MPAAKSQGEEPRRGIKTSEWWLTLLTSALGLAVMAGWVNPEGVGTVDKLAGMAVAALAAMGYQISRGIAKGGVGKK